MGKHVWERLTESDMHSVLYAYKTQSVETLNDVLAQLGIQEMSRRAVKDALSRRGLLSKPSKPDNVQLALSPSLAIQRLANHDTDEQSYHKRLNELLGKHVALRVAHVNDVHFPYHDTAALAMTYKVLEKFRPHVIAVGSDAFDLPELSRFEADKDVGIDDWLEQITPLWHEHIKTLSQIAPQALLVYLWGNHEMRAYAAGIQASTTPRTLMRTYVDLVRVGGRVKYLGLVDEVRINNLIVTHGHKATVHTALAMLNTYHRQLSVMAGHSHRPDFYTVRGAYSVSAVVAGCNCQLVPHYHKTKRDSDWQHGTALATVTGNITMLQNIVYQHTDTTLAASFGNDLLTIAK